MTFAPIFFFKERLLFFSFLNFWGFIYLFIYLWLCWVFVSVRGLSPVAACGGHSSSRCAGLSLSRPLLLRSTGSRRAGSVVVAHGILPDQGPNPCPLHWQADSQPLRHQGSPAPIFECPEHCLPVTSAIRLAMHLLPPGHSGEGAGPCSISTFVFGRIPSGKTLSSFPEIFATRDVLISFKL